MSFSTRDSPQPTPVSPMAQGTKWFCLPATPKNVCRLFTNHGNSLPGSCFVLSEKVKNVSIHTMPAMGSCQMRHQLSKIIRPCLLLHPSQPTPCQTREKEQRDMKEGLQTAHVSCLSQESVRLSSWEWYMVGVKKFRPLPQNPTQAPVMI